ncbi:MAG: caspase family protein [Bacteroidales bacterium]
MTEVRGQEVETVVQTGHYGEISAVAFSVDGMLTATGSADKTVKLWHSSDGREIRTYQGSSGKVVSVEFNRQGTALIALGDDGKWIVWEVSTGKIIIRGESEGLRYTAVSFHPDGKRLVAGTYRSHLHVIDMAAGERIMEIKAAPQDIAMQRGFEYESSGSVKYSIDGRYIAAGVGDYTAILFDAESGREIRKFKRKRSSCTTCITEAVISGDNRYLFLSRSDSVQMFDLATGRLVREFYGQGGSAENLIISNDGKFIAAVEYGTAYVWETETGKQIFKSGDYYTGKILSLAFSPDGRRLLAGNENRTADIFDIKRGAREVTLHGYLNQIDESVITRPYMYWAAFTNEVKLSPDGKYIAVGRTGNNAKLVDFKTGRIHRTLRGHEGMVISLSFSMDGRYLATGGIDGRAVVWDVETGNKACEVTFSDRREAVYSVDISDDNTLLATASWGGTVVIWDIATGERVRTIVPHDHMAVYKVKFMPGAVYFISAGLDKNLKLIEIDTGEEIRLFKGHTDLVNSISLNSRGDRFVTSGWDGTIRVWDFMSGLQVLRIRAHEAGVYSASFDRSGDYLVSGGDDFLVKYWDATTGKLISEFAGHQGGVGDVSVTDDLNYIISGSRDGSVRIWDVEGRREVVSMIFINEDDWFISNKEGYFDASEGAFGSVSFVKGNEIYAAGQFFNEFYRPGLYRTAFLEESPVFRQSIAGTVTRYPPPSVEFVTPEDEYVSDEMVLSFMVKVTNNGGGVRELKVMQNGKRQEVDYSDLRRLTRTGSYAMKTFALALVPGENEIEVTAMSDGEIESQRAVKTVTYNGLQKTADCYILSVGINSYENESLNLSFARGDARIFASEVAAGGKELFNKVYNYTLFDRDATKAKVLSTLDEIGKRMRKEDLFIFFFAGHGSTVGNDFYFITTEITGIYQTDRLKNALHVAELQEKFKQLPALKQVVFIDACHSGGSVEYLAMRGSAEEKALAQLSRSSGIHVIASSERAQQSAEIHSLNHGLFTYVLLEALRGKADGAPADKKITVYELKSYVDDQVPELSYRLIRHRQFPSTFSIGHDFPLIMNMK